FIWFAATKASLFEVAIQSLIVYAIYYAFWSSIIRPGLRRQASEAARNDASRGEAASAAGSVPRPGFVGHIPTAAWPSAKNTMEEVAKSLDRAKQRRRSRSNWRDRANQQLATKPMRQKLT